MKKQANTIRQFSFILTIPKPHFQLRRLAPLEVQQIQKFL
jgi:hypothetical protein